MVDVEWRLDDEHPDGTYRLQVFTGRDFSGDLIHTFYSNDRFATAAEIERVLSRIQVNLM
jgi:hypothetical protein